MIACTDDVTACTDDVIACIDDVIICTDDVTACTDDVFARTDAAPKPRHFDGEMEMAVFTPLVAVLSVIVGFLGLLLTVGVVTDSGGYGVKLKLSIKYNNPGMSRRQNPE